MQQSAPKSRQLHVRITEELGDAAEAQAEERGETVSVAVRRFLEHYSEACSCCGRLPTREEQ
jgi:hypothetical protein